MIGLSFGLVGAYGIVLLLASIMWAKAKFNMPLSLNRTLQGVSVVIPFRNEQTKLNALICSFRNVRYPSDLIEFIFINDHSTDNSKEVLNNALKNFPFKFKILEQDKLMEGKKYAQLLGITNAQFDIILSTDADCEVPFNWVNEMQSAFEKDYIQFVAGNLTFSKKGFWNDLLRIEIAPLLGITGLTIETLNPSMANGANMAFRKSSYQKVLKKRTDLKQFPSGDDMFLLAAIKDEYGSHTVVFHKSCVVATAGPASFSEFYHQRVRWASKWRAQGTVVSALPALSVWLFHLLYIMAIALCLFNNEWIIALSLFTIKMTSEYLFIHTIFKAYHHKINILGFLCITTFYSFYVIFFGLSANFGKYKWKQRAYG